MFSFAPRPPDLAHYVFKVTDNEEPATVLGHPKL